MVCETFAQGDSIVHRLDPRGRVVVGLGFSLLMAVSSRFPVLASGLALSAVGAMAARLPLVPTLKRLAAVNAFMVLLWLLLPLTSGGSPWFGLGPLAYSRDGAWLAGAITLKANAIVLAFTVLLATVEITSLGHALRHLHVPDKLTHLFLFTVRYIDVLHHEYQRLSQAMTVRCFRPRLSRHTCRTYGYLVGMLLVNSLDRSERIVAAMKCRGFVGRFYVLDHFTFARRDAWFAVVMCAALAVLGWMEWS